MNASSTVRKYPGTTAGPISRGPSAKSKEPELNDLLEVLKVQEVAALLRVDRKTVYDLIDRRELRAIRVGRRRLIRVPRAMLRSYLEGRAALTGGIHASTT